MGWFTNGATDAAEAGKADAEADKKAGGFARGWNGTRRGEMSEAETKAYDKAYTRNAPRSWRSR
jgi:hypothetical protein